MTELRKSIIQGTNEEGERGDIKINSKNELIVDNAELKLSTTDLLEKVLVEARITNNHLEGITGNKVTQIDLNGIE